MELTQLTDGTTIIVLGSWNQRIFTPDWISGGRLTDLTEIPMEIAPNQPQLPIRYLFDGIVLSVSGTRIVISPQDIGTEHLNKMEETVIKICKELTHTPVSAYGINFRFKATDVDSELLRYFNGDDLVRFTKAEFSVARSGITRVIKLGQKELNLELSQLASTTVQIAFNYHQAVKNTLEIAESIRDTVESYNSKSIEILELLGVKKDDDDKE